MKGGVFRLPRCYNNARKLKENQYGNNHREQNGHKACMVAAFDHGFACHIIYRRSAVYDGVYLSFCKEPLIKNEVFCKEDRESIFKAIKMVGANIISNSPFHNNTVIQICSLQYSLCYYQEEAMVVAMLNWCSKTFNFELKNIESRFDYENNKYIFDLKEYTV